MPKKRRLIRTARVLTYHFNALIDAQISQELIVFIKSNGQKFATHKTEAQKRAQFYTQLKNDFNPRFLAGLAYSLYYANGLANWLYTQFFWPLLGSDERSFVNKYVARIKNDLTTPHFFQEFRQKHYSVSYWPTLVLKQHLWLEQFLQSRSLKDLNLKIEQKELTETALLVQKHNSQFNQKVAIWLKEQNSPNYQKIKLLKAAADETDSPQQFLTTCAKVQKAASRWDELYTQLIKNKK